MLFRSVSQSRYGGSSYDWSWESAEAALANNEIELVSVPATRLDMEVLGDDI